MGRNNDIELLDAGCCWRGAVGGGGGGNCSSIGESRLVSTLNKRLLIPRLGKQR